MPLPLVFDFFNSIIEVPAPDNTLDMQYLIDQIRDAEDELVLGLEYGKIAEASGKDSLGGGLLTAITVRLLDNWQVRFEARPGPAVEQMIISGGNLVGGPGGIPIAASAFTQVVQQSSSSGVIATPNTANDSTNLKYMVASMMLGKQKAIGNVYYWDPVAGSDSNNGLTPASAVRTFTAAHGLVNSGANDVIFAIASHGSGITTVNEQISISKNNLKLKGPGYIFQLAPTTSTADTVVVTADNVEISGIYVSTHNTGGRNALRIAAANNVVLTDCWISNPQNHGVVLDACNRTIISKTVIEHAGLSGNGSGVVMDNGSTQNSVEQCIVFDHASDGINLVGATTSDNVIENCLIYNNGAYGIRIGSGVLRTTARGSNTLSNNATANILDSGTDSHIETNDTSLTAPAIADAVWDEVISGHLGPNTTGRLLKDAKVKATLASMS